MDLTRVAILALAAAVAASFAQTGPAKTEVGSDENALRSHPEAQAQSRTELIESARTEKEAHLTPWAEPKAQRVIERAQNSLPYRLLTGEAHGFAASFGNMVPGSGFAIGPTYTKPIQDGKLILRLDARAAINQSYGGRLEVAVPRLFSDHAFATFSTQHRNISEMPYYGPGPDSTKTGRSNYRLEETNVELRPGVRVFKGLSAGLIGSYLAVNTGTGHSTRYISTEEQFGPAAARGIDRQTNFWRGGGFVEYDWRDQTSFPSSGGRYSAQYVRYLDKNPGAYSFLRLDLDASQYIPLFNRTRVIGLHGSTSLTSAGKGQTVPFYVQPTLGGSNTLRGYRFNRFYGDNSVMVNGEYRWFCSPTLDMAVFADAGKVFQRWEQWNLHNLESDVGFSVRFKGRSERPVFSVDTGFSHEGFQIWFRVNTNN
ncbi:MAG: BamA/TamA family outer membrane protein [Bryobacterales bacterium]|nr:BamA/TamA family outer membrane protein [Bryobacterales bacterium]